MRHLIFSVLVLAAVSVEAKNLTTVCQDPVGHAFGFFGGKEQFEKDGMRGGQVVLSYSGGQSGTVVVQGAGGGTPMEEEALLINATATQFSFYVAYPQAIWVYTIFPVASKMLLTQHSNGPPFVTEGAWGKLLIADCDISFK